VTSGEAIAQNRSQSRVVNVSWNSQQHRTASADFRIEDVIAALDNPVQLRVVRTRVARVAVETMTCHEILPEMTKSTASHR
jgi:hypothetical protein